MFESADLQINRAAEHFAELNELFREQRPFSYVVETNIQTDERATFARKNQVVIDRAALICGETVHCLRVALDHAYWEIVGPFARTAREERKVQFPFCNRANRLDETVRSRLADRVSPQFFDAILGLKPYSEAGGNQMLYLIDRMDIIGKHRDLIPTGDYTRLTRDIIRQQVSDFPLGNFEIEFSQNRRDVVWQSQSFDRQDIGAARPPTTNIFQKELEVPVEIIFVITEPDFRSPVIPTLNKLIAVTKKTISSMGTVI